jgi:curved DNA-binding protein CbpA
MSNHKAKQTHTDPQQYLVQTAWQKMALTLEQARTALGRRDWFFILGLRVGASEHDVTKARRELQRRSHQDKVGGSGELSRIINQAADELLNLLRPGDKLRREQQHREEEEQERRKEEQQRQENFRRYLEEMKRRVEEGFRRQLAQRAKHHLEAVRYAHSRGAGNRTTAYLSVHAGRAFPTIRCRVQKLQKHPSGSTRAKVLTYVVESEIAARRAAREEKWPKTENLIRRQPEKWSILTKLKVQYDRVYQQLRYFRKTKQPYQHALLTTRRLLREAWMTLLAMPPPLHSSETIVL